MLAYAVRLAPGCLRLIAGPQISLAGIKGHDTASGRFSEAALAEAITRINKAIADVVAAHPEQWLWGHKRWKTRPPGEPPLY
jgi:lauroyl/myristoyl acyltransferase